MDDSYEWLMTHTLRKRKWWLIMTLRKPLSHRKFWLHNCHFTLLLIRAIKSWAYYQSINIFQWLYLLLSVVHTGSCIWGNCSRTGRTVHCARTVVVNQGLDLDLRLDSWRGGWVWGWSRSIAGERDMKFGNFVCEEVSETVGERRAWGRGR